ncbi:hypothetical protein T02_3631 [Trichinella nativa]|uniref:Uncharacterized protein n=3 Tax=Trichinella TaxID=6333 RepID=A0A0V1LBA7_9BILA|nr:hypothetical protein T05_2790 [Trichinella murrelli]KRX61681.1 hypothetical protein T09_2700 [Trichinella sp. T9]KRX81408.1 hypothetical protein T06_15582 [Trichinella sp. T6]KRY11386.1 hypothetical protein T12_7949 [Trichinella patagoniensis]KRZ56773.1 hypothetical protein T02_3631 [Trichinella nativa]KRZ92046.1 hypothetical protein T08_14166 [Trichinella sp. T8]
MFGKLASLGGYVLLLVNVTRGRPWTDLIQSAKVNVIVKNNQGQPGPLQGCRLLDVIVATAVGVVELTVRACKRSVVP